MTNISNRARGAGPDVDGQSSDRHVLPLRPAAGRSVATLLEAVVAEIVAEREVAGLPSVSIVLDPGSGRIQPADGEVVRVALRSLVAAACEAAAAAAPRLREVVVTVVATAAALEIEVADSGSGAPGDSLASVRPAVERIGGTLAWRGCPEGGLAVTLRLPHHRLKSRAA